MLKSKDDIDDLEKEIYENENENDLDETENEYVSAIVPTTDDPSIPSLSFRVIFIGTLWNILLACANSIFAFRTNPFGIPSNIATLLSYPMAIFFSRVLPTKQYSFFGYKWTFNPGPFSVKEHVLIYIIASSGAGIAYGVDNVVVQKFKNFMGNSNINYFDSLAFVLSVQLLGFGMAGLLRRFLVKPASMYWPGILGSVALFVGFHENISEQSNSRFKLSRFKFFSIAAAMMFVYTWIPQYFVVVLQGFSVICFMTSNSTLKFLSSSDFKEGVGLGSFSLDWQLIGGGSLTTPFWASCQFLVSNVIWLWIVVPSLYYSNFFGGDLKIGHLNSNKLYNHKGLTISPIDLMDSNTYNLNETAYNINQPIYITTFFAVKYGQEFMTITAALMHVFIFYGKSLTKQFKAAMKQSNNEEMDIHNHLMEAYPDVSEWTYLAFFIFMIFVQCCVSQFSSFSMPIWSVFLCISLCVVFLLPIGIIAAVTGIQIGLNVLSEFVIGLMIPGETIAIMAFKSLGTNSIQMALGLIKDLKLGHYLKINPVHMIFAQFYGTIIGCIIQNSVSIAVESLMKDLLFKGDWKVTSYNTFYSAGAIWGAIGPQRFFGIGSVYQNLLFFFLAGALLPILPWLANKIYPSRYWAYINIPILAHASGILISFLVSWFFQYYVFNKHREWWKKYNYTLAIALDIGFGLSVFCITILKQCGIKFPNWSGNPTASLDYYCMNKSWDS